MHRVKLVAVPWTLRAQPATPNSPATPKRRVEVQMEPDTYRLFLRLRAKVFDGERLLLEGDELHAALDEMHNLVEMTFLLGAQVTAQPPVEADYSARTEALAAVERLESEKGWKVPDAVKESLSMGQTTMLDAPVLADEAYARNGDPWTSHAAASSLSAEDLRATQAAVLACFKRFGAMYHEELQATYESTRHACGWPQQSVSGLRTRTSELVDGGLIRDSGRTVKLASNKSSIVWEVAA